MCRSGLLRPAPPPPPRSAGWRGARQRHGRAASLSRSRQDCRGRRRAQAAAQPPFRGPRESCTCASRGCAAGGDARCDLARPPRPSPRCASPRQARTRLCHSAPLPPARRLRPARAHAP
eukprot:1806263-Prymnesium_polylepis.1